MASSGCNRAPCGRARARPDPGLSARRPRDRGPRGPCRDMARQGAGTAGRRDACQAGDQPDQACRAPSFEGETRISTKRHAGAADSGGDSGADDAGGPGRPELRPGPCGLEWSQFSPSSGAAARCRSTSVSRPHGRADRRGLCVAAAASDPQASAQAAGKHPLERCPAILWPQLVAPPSRSIAVDARLIPGAGLGLHGARQHDSPVRPGLFRHHPGTPPAGQGVMAPSSRATRAT